MVTLFQRLKHVDSLWHQNHWQLFLLSHQLPSMQKKKMDRIASLKLQKLVWVHLQQWPLLWLLLCFITLEWLIFHPCLKMRDLLILMWCILLLKLLTVLHKGKLEVVLMSVLQFMEVTVMSAFHQMFFLLLRSLPPSLSRLLSLSVHLMIGFMMSIERLHHDCMIIPPLNLIQK